MTPIDTHTEAEAPRELPQPAPHAPSQRRRRIKTALSWLIWVLLLTCCGWIANRTAVVTDITGFLPGPATRAQALLATQLRDGVAARLVLIGVQAESDDQVALAAQVAQRLAGALAANSLFALVADGSDAGLARERDRLFAARYLLSPAVRAESFTVEGLRARFAELEQALQSAAAPLILASAARDPSGEFTAVLAQFADRPQPLRRHGVWFSADGRTALVLAQTLARGFDGERQAAALRAIDQAYAAALAASTRGVSPDATVTRALQLHLAGPGVFAVQSRDAIERDAQHLSILAAVLIAALLLWALRSPRFLALAIVPVVSGVAAGLAAAALAFGAIHAITLGFGLTLIGEAVDYAIYVQVQRTADANNTRLWRALWVAVLTSSAGFVAMMASGFQGLVELGLFSLAGIVAAALAARFLLPAAARDLPDVSLGQRERFAWLQRLCDLAPIARWPLLAAAVLALAFLAMHAAPLWNDELGAISPLARSAGELDGKLRGGLGLPDLRWLIAVDAPDLATALIGAEALEPALDALRARGDLAGFDSPARLVPSENTQRARRDALPAAEELQARLAVALRGTNFRVAAFAPFVADVEQTRRMAPLDASYYAGTMLGQSLANQLQTYAGGATALITLRGVRARAPVARAIAARAGVTLLDMKGDVEDLISSYRQRALWAALLGAVAIVALLAWRVGETRATLRIAAALGAAVVLTAATLLATTGPLTLFHLVALLLVVGVGSNYALFFGMSVPDPKERAAVRVSVFLCAAATGVAFALLAASSTPVLHMIGGTVALGTFYSFITSASLAASATS